MKTACLLLIYLNIKDELKSRRSCKISRILFKCKQLSQGAPLTNILSESRHEFMFIKVQSLALYSCLYSDHDTS